MYMMIKGSLEEKLLGRSTSLEGTLTESATKNVRLSNQESPSQQTKNVPVSNYPSQQL